MSREKIAMAVGGVVEAIGFILLLIGYEIGNDALSYIGVALFFGGGIVLLVTWYLDRHPSGSFPIKKALVCLAILVVGIVAGVFITSFTSNATGWVPVGFEYLSVAIPIVLSIAACIWYWQNND